MDISYILNELAEDRSQYFNAVSPPIVQTSNFSFKTVADLHKAFEDEMGGYLYSRGLNPTVDILRKKLAALDGAEDCLVFNSGAAAIFASVFSQVKSGDHIISVKDPYTWAKKLFDDILPKFNISTTYIDGKEIGEYKDALQENTRVIYLESPNSWNYAIQPLAEVAALAKEHDIITIIDNSYCTPLYQRPIEMGIDISLQTATKYISGHSDTLGGVVSAKHHLLKKMFDLDYLAIGSGIQPFNAWLLIRGLRTLPARLERIGRTTQAVLEYLKKQPKVDSLLFPFDSSFPQYELAKQQMTSACGLFTFSLKNGTEEKIVRFCESLQHIMMAVSWGGHESLVIPRCAGLQPGTFDAYNAEHQHIRMYVGLEDADYIISDLQQAFEKID